MESVFEDDSADFLQYHSKQLINFVNKNDTYTTKLCYWLISCLNADYEGDSVFNLVPLYDRYLTKLNRSCCEQGD